MTTLPYITNPGATLSCRDAVELLPWLINGSLEAGEERALRGHLGGCDSCRVELGETVEAWELATRHIPSLALAEFALGVAPASLDRHRIERHLALCPSCRQELEGIWSETSGQVVDLAAARAARRTAPARWDWAVAAAVAGLLAVGGWAVLRIGPSPATGNLAATTATDSAESVGQHLDPPRAEPPRVFQSGGGVFSDGFESGSVVVWAEFETDKPST